MLTLNIRHLVPNFDDIMISLSRAKCPDILGLCETFLTKDVSDGQVSMSGYVLHRKDRNETVDKLGGGIVCYVRESIECNRRSEFEISNIETMWLEIILPKSRPLLVCTVYRPPDARSNWIDGFEDELSVAHGTNLEVILMGDFNID